MSAPFEIDHVFVCAAIGAPEAHRLSELGLQEGSSNRHPGQGSANRRFFFANAMLELLWVDNAADAQSEPARGLHLWERWSQRATGACPFGICLRPGANGSPAVPFPAWDYSPPYSPVALPVAQSSALIGEPLLFYMPVHRRMDALPLERREPIEHALGIRELSSVKVHAPSASVSSSPSLQAALATGTFRIEPSASWLLELAFDHEVQQRYADLRPQLPLLLRW